MAYDSAIPQSELDAAGRRLQDRLTELGVELNGGMPCCRDESQLYNAVAQAIKECDTVIITGDSLMARRVVSRGLNLPLEPDEQALRSIQNFLRSSGTGMESADLELAVLPRGATAFLNPYGRDVGCALSSGRQSIVILPGEEQSLIPMMRAYLTPYLRQRSQEIHVRRMVRIYGVDPVKVRRMVNDLLQGENPKVTVLAADDEAAIQVEAFANTQQQAVGMLRPILKTIASRLGDAAYGVDLPDLPHATAARLHKKKLTLAIAEAGTDGAFTLALRRAKGEEHIADVQWLEDADDAVDILNLRRRPASLCALAAQMAQAVRENSEASLGIGIVRDIDGAVYSVVCDDELASVTLLPSGGSQSPTDRQMVSHAMNTLRLFIDYMPDGYGGTVSLKDAVKGNAEPLTPEAINRREPREPDGRYRGRPAARGRTGRHGGGGSNRKGGSGGGKIAAFLTNIMSKDQKSKANLTRIVFILAALVFIGSMGWLVKYGIESRGNQGLYNKLTDVYDRGNEDDDVPDDFPKDYRNRFAGLYAINSDIIGWLYVEGTAIQYPVVQADDNTYYLTRNFEKKESKHGTPFLDADADAEEPSDQLVIYGHNMKDGQMFGKLEGYRDLDFYKEHPVISFDNIYENDGESDYLVVSVFLSNVLANQGTPFPYTSVIDFYDEEDFDNYIYQIQARSLIDTPVDLEYGDKLLTLSTCVYDFEDARLVVVARQVRADENASVDVERASRNANPLYPDIWYEINGGTPPIVDTFVHEAHEPEEDEEEDDSDEDEEDTEEEDDEPSSSSSRAPSGAGSTYTPPPPASTPPASSIAPAPSSSVAQSGEDEDEDEEDEDTDDEPDDENSSSDTSQDDGAIILPGDDTDTDSDSDGAGDPEAVPGTTTQGLDGSSSKSGSGGTPSANPGQTTGSAALESSSSQSGSSSKRGSPGDDPEAPTLTSAKGGPGVAPAPSRGRPARIWELTAKNAGGVFLTSGPTTGSGLKAKDGSTTGTSNNPAASGKNSKANSSGGSAVKSKEGLNGTTFGFEENADSVPGASKSKPKSNSKSASSSGKNAKKNGTGTLSVKSNGRIVSGDALDIVARAVQGEMGHTFETEALKAQAVAVYSYIRFYEEAGLTPALVLASSANQKVTDAVSEVLGEAVYYNGGYAMTPFCAISSGYTASSKNVWGSGYSYLTSVESEADKQASGYKTKASFTSEKAASLIQSRLGITVEGDPADWFEILDYVDNNYVGNVSICGYTKSGSGKKITGRVLRESVFSLRSAAFDILYDEESDTFVFTVYGYGHGVGMSQLGANYLAKEGWTYKEILEYYYPGTSVE